MRILLLLPSQILIVEGKTMCTALLRYADFSSLWFRPSISLPQTIAADVPDADFNGICWCEQGFIASNPQSALRRAIII